MSGRRGRKAPKSRKPSRPETETVSRASPESEGRFPAHLTPIIQCKKSVLDRSRLELYVALGIGLLQSVFPMNAFTRSAFLFGVLALLIDVAWRSP
jgi:hypothetical protein